MDSEDCKIKYGKDLFFLAPFYHREYPAGLHHLIVLDIDLHFMIDLHELNQQFDLMTEKEVFGIAGEFKIWFYKFLTTEFRDNEPKTTIASPGRKQCQLNVLSWQYPEYFYQLPCQFNVQHDQFSSEEIEQFEDEEFYEDFENDLIDQVLGRNPQDKRYQYCKQLTKICHRNY
ncbi:uncharacterized protein LOC111708450 [Eurytemora carolleeae]|uniref:uncharacterized protein LOC111708450 n=1 Tax=Eurytemora carolleeae TaxID=1294199 RepID=UPI000C7870C2|nr:uncharacterized protein LOC111708450 [Eurytemora carolleeae]|eukprot:XP_023337595.1 uncharacterized protein LOC111708450 [Eurytemora affinis]